MRYGMLGGGLVLFVLLSLPTPVQGQGDDCCWCGTRISENPIEHKCAEEEDSGDEEGDGFHGDYQERDCAFHNHWQGCPSPDKEEELALASLWDLTVAGDVQAWKSLFQQAGGWLEFNTERKAIQYTACDGVTYVGHIPLDTRQVANVQQALVQVTEAKKPARMK